MDTAKAATVGEMLGLKVSAWAKGQAIQQKRERTRKSICNCFQDFIAIAILLSLSPPSNLLLKTKLKS